MGSGCQTARLGPARLAETTSPGDPRTCWLWVTAPPLGHPIPLPWATILSFPIGPKRWPLCHLSEDRAFAYPASLEMAAPPPQLWKMSAPSHHPRRLNRSYPHWPLGMVALFPPPRETAAPSPGGGKQNAPSHQLRAWSLSSLTGDRPAPRSLGP